MTTAYKNTDIVELSIDDLSGISGGTFTPNTYPEQEYNSIGITTRYHFWDKDEFFFMGQSISIEQADEMVRLARYVDSVINEGYQGANRIGYGEKLFIQAFNSQIYVRYGIIWDGIPGLSL